MKQFNSDVLRRGSHFYFFVEGGNFLYANLSPEIICIRECFTRFTRLRDAVRLSILQLVLGAAWLYYFFVFVILSPSYSPISCKYIF